MKRLLTFAVITSLIPTTSAFSQTDVSLFMKSDHIQRAVVDTTLDNLYKPIGHHGPAVENSYMALRLYFKAGCAVDVYSKNRPSLELRKFGWYPTEADIAAGSGCDEYRVGKTTGLGGFSLWDGEKQVLLEGTEGRRTEVRKTKDGAEMSMLVRGVEYKGGKVDIKVSVRVWDDSRLAEISAESVGGQKVTFMSGVNFHQGQQLRVADGRVAVWGVHPADVVKNPLPIGAGLAYNTKAWDGIFIDNGIGFAAIRTRKPVGRASVRVVAACSREDALNTCAKFFDYVFSLKK
ncbi:MAG: DUF4861 family protein [Marinilabiliaceae bacterium]